MSWRSAAASCWEPTPEATAGPRPIGWRASSLVRRLGALALPSYSDWLFAALIGWLFVVGHGWSALLADGDTGWHIRAGEYILAHGRLPVTDPFSFTRTGQAWFAWEWLSDVLFAGASRLLGLKGVVLLAGLAIALYLTVLVRHMLWRKANAFVALAVCLLGAGASGIHYLARPHVFTLLLLAVALWLVDRDREKPTRAVWLLVPLTAIWANLHAGFLALLACLAIRIAGGAIEACWERRPLGAVWRGLTLLTACSAASLANPYGYKLHLHIAGYLRSDWIREAVDEFQSPKFRSESAIQFEILLFAGLIAAGLLLRRRRVTGALLILAWAHAALVSVRHVPVFVVVAAPILAAEVSRWWAAWADGQPARSVAGVFNSLALDFTRGFRRTSLWPVALVAALVLVGAPLRWPRDFPAAKFPVELTKRQEALLAGARVFTSDQWGDYLIYRFYPRQRVFIDGRSDFYGKDLGKLYLRVAYGHGEWRSTLERYGIGLVLAPVEWPLASILRREPGWRLVEEDRQAALFERVRPWATPLKKTPSSAEVRPGGRPDPSPQRNTRDLFRPGAVARSGASARKRNSTWTADC
jgi:hypothetical protein